MVLLLIEAGRVILVKYSCWNITRSLDRLKLITRFVDKRKEYKMLAELPA